MRTVMLTPKDFLDGVMDHFAMLMNDNTSVAAYISKQGEQFSFPPNVGEAEDMGW